MRLPKVFIMAAAASAEIARGGVIRAGVPYAVTFEGTVALGPGEVLLAWVEAVGPSEAVIRTEVVRV